MTTLNKKETTLAQEQKVITNPYPGLRPFRNDESHLFFGREDQVEEVLKKLLENKFIGIVGTSGIGKSSFMYCGVLPTLISDYQTEHSSQWDIITCNPGNDPLRNLAKAITPEANKSSTDVDYSMASLIENSGGLVNLVEKRHAENQKNHLIFIDHTD